MNIIMVLGILVLCDFTWNETRWLRSGQLAMTDAVDDARSKFEFKRYSDGLFDFMP